MLTCTDDEAEWAYVHDFCCLCGSTAGVVHCPECGHDFCRDCKTQWFKRGLEAVKTLLGHSTLLCGGGRHG